jgi:peptidoglycan/xylan/chitin deacetylase (PgdA/CDA1 family)
MLLALTYHHVNSDEFSNTLAVIEDHFKYISNHYKTIFPSEYQPSFFNLQLCLVFDDAYYDFYYYIYNLLKKYKIKAVLAVPTSYILDDTNIDSETRLSLKHSEMMKSSSFKNIVPFCTWNEIKEMSESKLVTIASHGHRHLRLAASSEDEINNELLLSKKIIDSKIGVDCNIFVYPYYSYDEKILKKTLGLYKYCFVAGGIMNYKIANGLIYRVSADGMLKGNALFTNRRLLGYLRRAIKNKVIKIRSK